MKFDLSIKGQLQRAEERLRLTGDEFAVREIERAISIMNRCPAIIDAIRQVGSIWEHSDGDSMTSIAEISVPQSVASGAPVRVGIGGAMHDVNIYSYSPHVGRAKCESANGIMFIQESDVIPCDVERFREICRKLAEDGQTELRFNDGAIAGGDGNSSAQ